MALKLGEILLKANLVTKEQLEEALATQKQNGEKLGTNLVKAGVVNEDTVTQMLSQQYGVPAINLSKYSVDDVVCCLDKVWIRRHEKGPYRWLYRDGYISPSNRDVYNRYSNVRIRGQSGCSPSPYSTRTG